MPLRRSVCLGVLLVAACGGDPVADDGADDLGGDAAETADAGQQAVAGDASKADAGGGKSEAADARVAPVDAGHAGKADAAATVPDAASPPSDVRADAGPSRPVPSCPSGPVFYSDRDGDGFGDIGSWACFERLNDVRNGNDCFDRNAKAHPGATDFQSVERGDGSFDYDCDGASEHRSDVMASCATPARAGWDAPAAPDCGKSAPWYSVEVSPYVGMRCTTSAAAPQFCR